MDSAGVWIGVCEGRAGVSGATEHLVAALKTQVEFTLGNYHMLSGSYSEAKTTLALIEFRSQALELLREIEGSYGTSDAVHSTMGRELCAKVSAFLERNK